MDAVILFDTDLVGRANPSIEMIWVDGNQAENNWIQLIPLDSKMFLHHHVHHSHPKPIDLFIKMLD